MLLLIYCLMYLIFKHLGSFGCCPFEGGGSVVVDLLLDVFPLFVGVLCLSLSCCALLCALSSFAIILKRKRDRAGCFASIVLPMSCD